MSTLGKLQNFWETRVDYLKGIGPQRAQWLGSELSIFTFLDLIEFLPFRYEDRTRIWNIREITNLDGQYIQLKGYIRNLGLVGEGNKQRLVGYFYDHTGSIELVWFNKIDWIRKQLKPGIEYLVYGRVQSYMGRYSIPHPDIEPFQPQSEGRSLGLRPVYHTTDKLRRKGIDSRSIARFIAALLPEALNHIDDPIPEYLRQAHQLIDKAEAFRQLHFPDNPEQLEKARYRMKFEEIFFFQLNLLLSRQQRREHFQGQKFHSISLAKQFIQDQLPFQLTHAQKRVLREIYDDLRSGKQMNRLVQGDVGSGKTIVAFIAALIAIEAGAQACLMAPTEILAEQHYNGFTALAKQLPIRIARLTGSTPQSERRQILQALQQGNIHLIVGTHALLEDSVQFHNLGLSIVDEQHRFGVAQRARLWQKNNQVYPHILVMTATPIPRTLAMTLYGDLDVSVIDELPPGRKPIKTVHRYDNHRLAVFGFVREQLQKGRQAYFVYPLIEEAESSDLKDLMDGYESICRAFPEYAISIVHGRMRPQDKDYEMQRFLRAETQIMVATTVIEVGVNVPNASVMVIENAERFGLAQLHQLRGRVGRGVEQSYCILMTSHKLSQEAKKRIQTMVETNDGFEIANVDLEIRGPGDLAGTRQSGVNFIFTNLTKDLPLIEKTKHLAAELLKKDPSLSQAVHNGLRLHLQKQASHRLHWARIS